MKISSLLLLLPTLLLTGCLSPGPSPSVRYFRITERAPAPEVVGSIDTPTQIGPVEIAPYLRRPQRAIRQGGQEIVYQEFERWAEPLEINLADTLTRDLAALLGSEQIIAYSPRMANNSIPQQLRLHIHRFDVNNQGLAELLATYSLITDPSTVPPVHRFQATLQAADPSTAAQVAALNSLVHQLADALAPTLATK
ncbi:MAG: PqiC family protein [Kiritimatiellia bacterium]